MDGWMNGDGMEDGIIERECIGDRMDEGETDRTGPDRTGMVMVLVFGV